MATAHQRQNIDKLAPAKWLFPLRKNVKKLDSGAWGEIQMVGVDRDSDGWSGQQGKRGLRVGQLVAPRGQLKRDGW